ncbi:hypothetical protein B7463_g1529, partial [Scytalidium lignicola]
MASTVSFSPSPTSDMLDINSFSNLLEAEAHSPRGLSHIKRRRATRACLGCRARKVRCNVTEDDGPCTNCRLDRLECVVRRRKRARPQQFQVHCFKQDPNYLCSPAKNVITIEDNGCLLDEERDQNTLLATPGLSLDLLGGDVPRVADNLDDNTISLSPFGGVDSPRDCHQANDNIFNQDLSQSTDFVSTTTFPVGVSGLNTMEKSSSNPLLPAYIKPLQGQVATEDIEYLHQRGALTIPDPELRNALLQGFTEYVYPYMPMLDLKDFVDIINQGDGNNGLVSLLLFQAVMFAGSAFIDMKHFSNAGYDIRRVARAALFQKVRLLYEFDSEPCVISQIQSLLLMTYYFNRPNEQKDLWYWIGIVVSLAHSAGLQWDPKNKLIPPTLREQHLRKRLWWSIFMRDQIIAIGMRRLPRIGKDDYNVPLLTLDDFECDADLTQLSILAPSCTMARDVFQRRQLAIMCMEKAKLSILMGLLLSSQYTISHAGHGKPDLMLSPKKVHSATQQARLCLQELGSWNSHLPRICVYDSRTALSHCESPAMIVHKAILRMIYLTTLSAVYRPEVLPICPWSASTTTLLHPKATDLVDLGQHAIHRSANEIACIAQDLQSLDLVRFLPTTVVTALLPAMMIHLLEIRSKSSQTTSLMPSFHLFGGCMRIMQKLHEMYASADFAIEFIEDTARKANVNVTFMISPRSTIATSGLHTCSSETLHDSEDSSVNSSLNRQHLFTRKITKDDESNTAKDLDSVCGEKDEDPKRGNAQGENIVLSRTGLSTDRNLLNFFNFTTVDSALSISPDSLLSGPVNGCQSQQESDLANQWNVALNPRDFVGSTGTIKLDSLDMIGDSISDVHDMVNLAMDELQYCNDSSNSHDFDFWGLFTTAV